MTLTAVPTNAAEAEAEEAANRRLVSGEESVQAENTKADVPTISTSNSITPASSGEGEGDGDDDAGVLPSYKSLFVFTATTILIWLSEPLLSLVDTTIVGLTTQSSKAVLQIAALGPATTLYDSAIYMTYFLAISMTNQLAPKLASKDWKGSRRSTSHLMGLAALFGGIVTLVTFSIGRQLISQMVGTAMDPTIIPLATNYARIRAIVSPFAVVGFVAQSFCLTILDTKTPAIAVAVASIVNVIGDLALSPRWGIQGAALATALATVASCVVLVNKVRETVGDWKKKEEEKEADSKLLNLTNDSILKSELEPETTAKDSVDSSASANVTTASETAGVTLSKAENIPFWSLPEKKATIKLLRVAGPIFFTMMAKVLCYSIMTVRASNFGVIPLASHNIMTRVFFFFACFGDSLSQAAQSFYPQVVRKSRGKLIKRLFLLSAVVGVNNYLSSNLVLQKLGRFLAKDASIIEMMSQYAPFVGYSVFLHPFIMVLEGTVLAKRDFSFMTGMYIATTLLHFGCVFSPFANTFAGLWQCLFGFQFLRLVQFGYRVWDQSRKENDSQKQTL
eukprot:CAMPEP_0113451298 /NCGR_PEP_ID=MMETSP0014_2-20120614/6266_1 /TAXON_ID=2857 /ORGANISM="Nitzschia sp." /LENGTH=563 /DNA_ID=CAMNT_0000342649 /DNA_START=582 /DNA_END=2273 /DNA_ORIENTATION=+ /assembly_acc=CAM_ASM_000159